MAYVDGFEHDIFLSYARVDDQAAAGTGAGWVSAFEQRLQFALDRRVGYIGIVRIWRDLQGIRGHQLFDQTIEDAVNTSAVFLGLTSRGYLASQYCRDEIACFSRRVSSDALGRAVGDQLRMINVRQLLEEIVTQPPGQQHPDDAELMTQTLAWERAGRNLTPEEWRQYLGKRPYRETCPR